MYNEHPLFNDYLVNKVNHVNYVNYVNYVNNAKFLIVENILVV
jgi:hypothetical protein